MGDGLSVPFIVSWYYLLVTSILTGNPKFWLSTERVRWTLADIQLSWPHLPRPQSLAMAFWGIFELNINVLMKAGARGVMGSALRSFPSSSSSLAFRLSPGLALLPCSVLPTEPVEKAITSPLGITNIVVVKCYPMVTGNCCWSFIYFLAPVCC